MRPRVRVQILTRQPNDDGYMSVQHSPKLDRRPSRQRSGSNPHELVSIY